MSLHLVFTVEHVGQLARRLISLERQPMPIQYQHTNAYLYDLF